MTRLAIAQGHRTPAPGRHLLWISHYLSDAKSSAQGPSLSARKLIAPLRKLKRALTRSAVPVAPSMSFGKLNGAVSANTAAVEATRDRAVSTTPAQASGKPLIAFIGAHGASGTALEFITREAAGRDTDFMEFEAIEDLFDFVEKGHTCDLALLDWDTLGHEALQYVRRRPAVTSEIAFIVMTNSASAIHRTAGAPVNAASLEDASDLPQRGDERPERRPLQVLRYGALTLDFRTDRALWKDRPVDLTVTQFNIVHLFARHVGENLTYRQIYDVVHKPGFHAGDGEDGYQTNVRSLIKRIRQQFRLADGEFEEIENHRGVGYRWRCAENFDEPVAPQEIEVTGDEDKPGSHSRWSKFVRVGNRPQAIPATIATNGMAPAADQLE